MTKSKIIKDRSLSMATLKRNPYKEMIKDYLEEK